jgi:hypothetical protein
MIKKCILTCLAQINFSIINETTGKNDFTPNCKFPQKNNLSRVKAFYSEMLRYFRTAFSVFL